VLEGPGAVFVFGQDQVYALEGDHAALVEAVLAAAGAPVGREELVAAVLREAGADASERAAVDAAVDLLVRLGALTTVVTPPAKSASKAADTPGAHVVVCVTGAVGAVYAPQLVERLVAAGHQVRVAMTRSARRFLAPRSFEAITHRPVATSLWNGTPEAPAPHIELAQWADAVVLYPCTATTLARLTAGDCSELVSAVATTTRAPVLLAPSMNLQMRDAPAVAENLAKLRERGMFVAYAAEGHEVADAPAERVLRAGVATPAAHVVRYVGWLLERSLSGGPRLLSRAAWAEEHAAQASRGLAFAADEDMVRALEAHAAPPARVLDVGTGSGAMARAAARKGYVVVATDFARGAIERAEAAAGGAHVTWLVDDVTEPSLVGAFDVGIDRGCLGCVPIARRERYARSMAALVRPGGVLLLKVHRAPAKNLRAHGFTPEEVLALLAPSFDPIAQHDAVLAFGDVKESPAFFFELRRRAAVRGAV